MFAAALIATQGVLLALAILLVIRMLRDGGVVASLIRLTLQPRLRVEFHMSLMLLTVAFIALGFVNAVAFVDPSAEAVVVPAAGLVFLIGSFTAVLMVWKGLTTGPLSLEEQLDFRDLSLSVLGAGDDRSVGEDSSGEQMYVLPSQR
jgi:hypothetical protein